MGAVETRPSRKMPIRILGVFFVTLYFYLLLLTMEYGGSERDEAGTDMGVDSLKPNWVLLATLCLSSFANHGLRKRMKDRKKAGRKIARPFWG